MSSNRKSLFQDLNTRTLNHLTVSMFIEPWSDQVVTASSIRELRRDDEIRSFIVR
ncbi:MAG: hypothetical protein JW891_16100 [Candidatus Lokiarchaeota archaeon]|nr:hypothetical protein [Candidatus Lokiarchaeota archaeon]